MKQNIYIYIYIYDCDYSTLHRNIEIYMLPQKNKKEVENQRTRCQNFQKSKNITNNKMIQSQKLLKKKKIDYTIEKYKR